MNIYEIIGILFTIVVLLACTCALLYFCYIASTNVLDKLIGILKAKENILYFKQNEKEIKEYIAKQKRKHY